MKRTTNGAAVLSYVVFHALIGEHSGFICVYPQCLPKGNLHDEYTFLCSFNPRAGLVKAGRHPCRSWTVSDGTIRCRTTRSALEESNSSLSSPSYVEDSQHIPLLKEKPSRANFATGDESPRNRRGSSGKQKRDVRKLKTDATTLMGSQDPGRAMGGERLIETIDFLGVFSESFKKINADAVEAAGNISGAGNKSQETSIIPKLDSDVIKKIDFLGVLNAEMAMENFDDASAFDEDLESMAFLESWNELKESTYPSENRTSSVPLMRYKTSQKSLNIVDLLKSNEEMMKKAGGSALGSEILLNTLAKFRPSFGLPDMKDSKSTPRIISIPGNLLQYNDAEKLIDVLDEFASTAKTLVESALKEGGRKKKKTNGPAAELATGDVVTVLNQLKRVKNSIVSTTVRERYEEMMDLLFEYVTLKIDDLSPKQVAIVLNAAIGCKPSKQLFRAASGRVVKMHDDPVRNFVFTEQSIAMILNAFTRARRSDLHRRAIQCLITVIMNGRKRNDKWKQNSASSSSSSSSSRPRRLGSSGSPRSSGGGRIGSMGQRSSFEVFTPLQTPARTQSANGHGWSAQNLGIAMNAISKLYHTITTARVEAGDNEGEEGEGTGRKKDDDEVEDDGAVEVIGFTLSDILLFLARKAAYLPPSTFNSKAIASISNACARGRLQYPRVFETLAAAVEMLPTSMWNSQEISMLANAMVRCGYYNETVIEQIGRVVCSLEGSSFKPQGIAMVTNALSKWEGGGEASAGSIRIPRSVWEHLSFTALSLTSTQEWSTQSLALVLNAFSYEGMVSREMHERRGASAADLLRFLITMAPSKEKNMWEPQETAMVLNGLARCESTVGDVSRAAAYMKDVCLLHSPDQLDMISISNIANAMAKLRMRDVKLMSFLAQAAVIKDPSVFSTQAISNIYNAFARLNVFNQKLCSHLSLAALLIHPSSFAPQNVGIIVNANANFALLDFALIRHMAHAMIINIDDADEQAVSNFIHSLATLDIKMQLVQDVLFSWISQQPPRRFAPQALANIAWSMAILNCTDEALLLWVEEALANTVNDMELLHLRQVHQFITWKALQLPRWASDEARALTSERSAAVRWDGSEDSDWKQFVKRRVLRDNPSTSSSNLQNSVALAIAALDLEMIEEMKDTVSGYRLDIFLPAQQKVVEVDGPRHFAFETRRPLGPTVLKRRILELLRYKPVTIPYWEWDERGGGAGGGGFTREQLEYLRSKIFDHTMGDAVAADRR